MRSLKLFSALGLIGLMGVGNTSYAQSPEISLREFASGQIKKGVRSIGMGGDGATWGNYSLVWRDSGTALVDAGLTRYSNGNNFSFNAVGFTTPALWKGLTVYAIALSQYAGDVSVLLKSPGLGNGAAMAHGNGTNQAFFIKSAMPLGRGVSVGILLSYERSQYDGFSDGAVTDYVRYATSWRPSGGFGVSWQPVDRVLVGVRALFNYDNESRRDTLGSATGLNRVQEYRAGISVGLWKGALADVGGNLRYHTNAIAGVQKTDPAANLGFEQTLLKRRLSIRAGLDESSGTGGFSIKTNYFVLDAAYVYNLGKARIGSLFGSYSNSVITTLIFNYGKYQRRGRHPA